MDRNQLNSQLTRIPGVIGSNILFSDDSLSEVHILADQTRKAKEIMLDAKALLSVVLQQPIDFRIISIAQIDPEENTDNQNPFYTHPPRLVIQAAYLKRLNKSFCEGVVDLMLGDQNILGRYRGINGSESMPEIICKAFSDALRELLPSHVFVSKVQFLSSYCLAEVQLSSVSTGETEEFVGAVKATGDQPWDVAKAILSAVNRRLEWLLQGSQAIAR
jgi:hypothetical protein